MLSRIALLALIALTLVLPVQAFADGWLKAVHAIDGRDLGARKAFKVNHLFRLHGAEQSEMNQAVPGDICAVAKVDEIHYDAILHDSHDEDHFHLKPIDFPQPMYGLAVQPQANGETVLRGRVAEVVPQIDPATGLKKIRLSGDTPSPVNPPPGCHFHPRCPIAREGICDVDVPALRAAEDDGDPRQNHEPSYELPPISLVHQVEQQSCQDDTRGHHHHPAKFFR